MPGRHSDKFRTACNKLPGYVTTCSPRPPLPDGGTFSEPPAGWEYREATPPARTGAAKKAGGVCCYGIGCACTVELSKSTPGAVPVVVHGLDCGCNASVWLDPSVAVRCGALVAVLVAGVRGGCSVRAP